MKLVNFINAQQSQMFTGPKSAFSKIRDDPDIQMISKNQARQSFNDIYANLPRLKASPNSPQVKGLL